IQRQPERLRRFQHTQYSKQLAVQRLWLAGDFSSLRLHGYRPADWSANRRCSRSGRDCFAGRSCLRTSNRLARTKTQDCLSLTGVPHARSARLREIVALDEAPAVRVERVSSRAARSERVLSQAGLAEEQAVS